MSACEAARHARLRAAALLALAVALYLPSLWTRDLWDPDEPKYAESAREMTSGGDFILPHLNGGVYSEKPPLFLWLSAAASHLPGLREGAEGRLISVLASAATLLLTWRIGAIVMGEATGALAAALTATSILFWQLSQSGVIDPLLTALVTASLHGYTLHRCGRGLGMPIFYGAAALGVLAKGPVAFLIPALAAIVYTVAVDGVKALRARHPIWGIPLVVAPVSIWLAAASARGGAGYAEIMLFKQNLGRAFHAFIHRQPIHYFVAALPVAFLPWTIFLPQAIVAAFREKVDRARPMLFPLAWFGSTFVLFSLISGKKTRYMMPLFPAAGLLVAGYMMRRLFEPDGRLRNGRGPLIAATIAGILIAAALAAPLALGEGVLPRALGRMMAEPGSEQARQALESILAWPGSLRLLIPAILLGGASAFALVQAARRRGVAAVTFLLGWTAFLAAAGLLWTPTLDEMKSARPLAEAIRGSAGSAPLYYIRGIYGGKINYHLRVDRIPVLHGADQVVAAAKEGGRFIGARHEIDRLAKRSGLAFRYEICRRSGDITLCLASLKEDASRAAASR